MAFHGLFIGIGRYSSPRINWLRFAKLDARATHALFTDVFGDGAKLLTDEDGTKGAIEKEFRALFQVNEDDVVVIFFSGHGSETHELVTYDANRSDLATTAIPLDTLTDWFKQIPARRLICILDCCFSGGAGAKALKADLTPKDLSSTDDLLHQLSGEGRLILTASLATEKAYEHPKIRHGLLTYFLLEALQGAPEVVQAGKITVYRLLDYITQRVKDQAAQFGKTQHPTLRGTIDDTLTWPVFKPGQLYTSLFPAKAQKPVSKDAVGELVGREWWR